MDPFTPRIAHLDEALVLAGTGGKLAVLTEKSGDSRGNSRVHDKSFGEIANGRAKSCAECFIRQFDGEILNREHPEEPHLVYFDFGAAEEEDLGSLCANVLALKQAGKNADTAWLMEKTGYQLSDAVTTQPSGNADTGIPAAMQSKPLTINPTANPLSGINYETF